MVINHNGITGNNSSYHLATKRVCIIEKHFTLEKIWKVANL